jgi:hypothetical protein
MKLIYLVVMVSMILGSRLILAETKGRQDLSHSTVKKMELKESTVDIQGKKFRKLEIDKGAVFVETLDSTAANEEMRVLCQEGHQEIAPAQIVAGAKLTQRSSLVVEGLRQVCKDAAGSRKEISLDPSILVGLQIEAGKSKSRKVIVSPFGINFKADW